MTTKTPRRGPAGPAADTTRAPTTGTHSFARVLAGTVALAKANAGKKKGKAKTAPGAPEEKPSAAAPKGKHRTPGTAPANRVGLGSFGHLRPTGSTAPAPTPATKPPRAATFSEKLASARAKLGRGTANAGATTTPATPGARSGGLLDKLRVAKRKLGRK
ncbi:hypothetical protein [uncultured Sphingomonas sp.]|uniref:hypothetical protein n=1 Tax=uncultured Sphingomonas sp. TaxID=158754 RepID=UPI0025E0D40A|nr:hypothetical protein [uncultured Sphingomonas sp.]